MTHKVNNKLFVISAPSGAGKTTIIHRLVSCADFSLSRIITSTTRKIRENEKEGVDYRFLSNEEFKQFAREDKFIEYSEVYGHYYGVLKEDIYLSENKIISLDIQGVKKFKKKNVPAIYILILPPNLKELRKRLLNRRTDNNKEIDIRLKEAEEEIRQQNLYDYTVENDDLDRATNLCKKIIIGEITNEEKK